MKNALTRYDKLSNMKHDCMPTVPVKIPPIELPTACIKVSEDETIIIAFSRLLSSNTSIGTMAVLLGSYIAATLICSRVAIYNAVIDCNLYDNTYSHATKKPMTSSINIIFRLSYES